MRNGCFTTSRRQWLIEWVNMQREFKLPDVGEGVAEGEIRKWLVREGDNVREFQPIAEIMTDKVNIEMTSPFTGKVVKLAAHEGEVVKVGQTILIYEAEGASAEQTPPPKAAPTQMQRKEAEVVSSSSSQTVRASPAVRKRARELGVDLTHVIPSDPSGRITMEDVERASTSLPAAASAPKSAPTSAEKETRVPVDGVRRRIFEKMTASKRNIPHFTYTDEVDMSVVVQAREYFAEKLGIKLTYLPFIVKALTSALREYPKLNSTYDEKANEIVVKHYYNVGIAVATEQGLIVPVIHNADGKDIASLAKEIEDMAGRARSGSLRLDEVQGGTITITNVGPIGGLFSTPVINYPESTILAVHKVEKRAVVREGNVVVREMMYFTVACDHRLIDGAEAAAFGNRLKEYLEHPYAMRLV
ncbi:MAG: dihydrolipoamide acetyltransferase family protein [Methanomassiliicoccales archaeon]